MKTRFLRRACSLVLLFSATSIRAQILMSGGAYSQTFDTLATSGAANPWVNNTTLPGWYATRNATNAVLYRAGEGTSNAGDLWSFGATGSNDRALGSVASGSADPMQFGLRFTNNTAAPMTNIAISFTGEQWRCGGNTAVQSLTFAYQVSSTPLTNPALATGWINLPALNFTTPTATTNTSALDGNNATNRTALATVLTGVIVPPGQEIFLRWRDVDDSGNDHGLAIDDLTVTFDTGVVLPLAAPQFTTQPQSQTATNGDTVSLISAASGNPAPRFQWQFDAADLPGETNATLILPSVTPLNTGSYRVIATNSQGSATSEVATLDVTVPFVPSLGFSLLTYNVKGNGATNWTTNSLQVQAIARQLQYLQPDVITFNEIPYDLRFEMTNFVTAFLPGYQLAISSGTDGSICSAIASRHPITRSSKWLDGIDLRSFGYSNANNSLDNFTRDLFETQIAIPGMARPLHVFTTHLKATSSSAEYADNALKRAAEAAAITNFFATNLFALYPFDPYTLSGDMNASDTNELCIQTLISPPTGLSMTQPRNPVTSSVNTYSTASANPSSRLDYIFPSPLLYSNIRTSMVFRTDKLTPLPVGLNSNDSQIASDHYPVLMVFNNPYDKPFQLLSLTRTNAAVTLKWESIFGQRYQLESSTNLSTWTALATNLNATGTNLTFGTNLNDPQRFFRVYRIP